MTDVFDRLANLISPAAQQYVYRHFPGQYDVDPLEPDNSYFQITLSQLYLSASRRWFQQLFPAAHTALRLQFADYEPIELSHATHVANRQLGEGISLNHPVTGLIPYNGGTVEIYCGLIALQGTDYLDAAVRVLGSFSDLVAGPVSQAIVVAGKVASSVHDLFVGNDGAMHLGFHQSYTAVPGGNNLRPGHYAAILATEANLQGRQLAVDADQLRADGQPFTGYDFLLFRVDSIRDRPDWRMKEIQKNLNAAKKSYVRRKVEEGDEFRAAALVAVFDSPDLSENDRWRVAERINQELDRLQEQGHGAIGELDVETSLAQLMAAGAMSWQAAAARGKPSLAELREIGHQ
jgi:rhodanese-related sulfurtransferase